MKKENAKVPNKILESATTGSFQNDTGKLDYWSLVPNSKKDDEEGAIINPIILK